MLGNDKMIVTGVNIAKQNSAPREMKKKIRATLHQLANKQLDIDEVTMGYLSHIRDIDPYAHSALMTFYNRKKIEYVGANRVSPGT
jgi:hypothetical protein